MSQHGECYHVSEASDDKALVKTRISILALLLLLSGAACLVAGLWELKLLKDERKLLALYGSLLGLLPGVLHSRYSRTAEPPVIAFRFAGAAVVFLIGFSISILPLIPALPWHNFLQVSSQSTLRWVDAISCMGITVVCTICMKMEHPRSNYVRHAVWAVFGSWLLVTLLAALVLVPKEYQPLLQHAAWHLEGVDFMWIAWLMTDRIAALIDISSCILSHSGMIICFAALCFHLRILTETLLGENKNVSLAIQMIFAGTFLVLWMLLCLRITSCLTRMLRLLRHELHRSTGAPKAEARWAIDVVRLELLACLLIAFSCTTLWWLPYKVVGWAEDEELAKRLLLIPVVVAHRFNHLIKAVSVAALSGLLWPSGSDHPPEPSPHLDRAPTSSLRLGDPELWVNKVRELAHRGVTLTSLLRFWCSLLEGKVMPSFDPSVSTTNDVVRLAIIPLSHDEATGQGHALASLWSQGHPIRAGSMVTHNWSNLFHHLVAGIFAHALGEEYYSGVAEMLLRPKELEKILQARGCGNTTYWVCAFSVNQHACICDDFGRAPAEGSREFQEWDQKRRDTATGRIYPVCPCKQRKFYNNEPALCEMNKFDAMMRHLSREGSFTHLVVADTAFNVFTRSWCIAEIVESRRSGIHQRIKLHSEATLDGNYQRLKSIDVRRCKASRPEDEEMILQSITDVATFNSDLQFAIFGTKGLLRKWADGPTRAAMARRFVRRASTFAGQATTSSFPRRTESV